MSKPKKTPTDPDMLDHYDFSEGVRGKSWMSAWLVDQSIYPSTVLGSTTSARLLSSFDSVVSGSAASCPASHVFLRRKTSLACARSSEDL